MKLRVIFGMFAPTVLLAACGSEQAETPLEPQRIELAEAGGGAPAVEPLTLPQDSVTLWQVDESGQAIHFGPEGAHAWLSLACRLDTDPPEMRIIRHARTRPGMKALFPVIGNGVRSRFLADATLDEGEWRWESAVAADDPMLDVFTGPRPITATMPGAGMIEIGGSRIPGEFVTWCRAGGEVMQVEAEELAEDAISEAAPAP